ncbi:MAG: (S)-benzoin forming benzil reductase [Bacteroidetes bacterium]|nr:(S)-benzoin forming benzil reductase [Bacteroidota bacterium]MBL0014915.1 (S)-benzoin forming benzil reductase [Bacteroidota bacterium]MBP6640216.1 (S)-benzoin forming benzil reductase [Bacteroidia bacterium]MBP6721439.1 (S)-benzoin forming benzil reductase [Bacteroidia bacterium]
MKRKYYIITGTSRGIGEALAKQVLGNGNVLFCISRNQNPRLSTEAHVKHWPMRDIAIDLNDTGKIHEMMGDIFRSIDPDDVEEIVLVNNAGIIHPIRLIGEPDASEKISRSINVNLTSAMLITDRFVRETESWTVPRKIMNLSSGAASHTVEGWSAYCAAKAGLEMFTRCLVDEQKHAKNPVKVVSFAPGVVNTEMQQEIRNANPENFPELARFLDMKEKGRLLEADFVAEQILSLLSMSSYGDQTVLHINDFI